MKKVKVEYILGGAISDGVLFETLNDALLVRKELDKAEHGVMVKFVKSKESDDRIGHIVNGFQPLEKSIATLAMTYGATTNTKAIYNLGRSANVYMDTLISMLGNGRTVFMNPAGGLCPVQGTLKILESEDIEVFPTEAKYYIGKNSKVINLENDFELENEATDYMRTNFKSYSYIKDMKVLTDTQFLNIFNEFVAQGGDTVYVYTTGVDYEQMYEYSRYALQSGLKNFIFDFNSGIGKDINRFIDWLSERANVKILNEYEKTES